MDAIPVIYLSVFGNARIDHPWHFWQKIIQEDLPKVAIFGSAKIAILDLRRSRMEAKKGLAWSNLFGVDFPRPGRCNSFFLVHFRRCQWSILAIAKNNLSALLLFSSSLGLRCQCQMVISVRLRIVVGVLTQKHLPILP
jgi:hypothetical protein